MPPGRHRPATGRDRRPHRPLARALTAGVLLISAGTLVSTDVGPTAAAWTASVSSGNTFGTLASWGMPLYSWGSGTGGRTGALLTGPTLTAVRVPGPQTWAVVAGGDQSTCGLDTGGALYCWGSNASGQLGVGDLVDRPQPTPVSPGTAWSELAQGYHDTCAIRAADAALFCWGDNDSGELGNGATSAAVTSPSPVGGGLTWASVTVGQDDVCGITTGGELYCWGDNTAGQLGVGDTTARTAPAQVGTATTWRSVRASSTSVCGVQIDDTLWCWGNAWAGQLADGGPGWPNLTVPTQVGAGYAAVSAGQDRYCALRTDATLWCWGDGQSGGLGNGGTASSNVPVQEATGGTTWASVTSLAHTSCATTTGHALYCWGQNGLGEIGDGTTTDRYGPVPSGSGTDWTGLSGGSFHVCGIRLADASLWCQGDTAHDKLGHWLAVQIGAPTPLVTGSTAVTDWTTGDVGAEGGCGLRGDATLWCWGIDSAGEVGVGDSAQHPFPVQVGADSDWTAISVGSWTVCGLRGTAMYCWGQGVNYQTGVGTQTSPNVPTPGPAGSWSAISVGESHTCALTTGRQLYCWGANGSGQVGTGDTLPRTTPAPVDVLGVSTWAEVSAGSDSTCAVAATGADAGGLFCWGANADGQVGDGTAVQATSPVRIGLGSWSEVAVGHQHACGVAATGALFCWGINDYGQLGQGPAGTPVDLTAPGQVGGTTTWTSVAAGWGVSCATRSDRTLWCWGRDDAGQLGDLGSAGTVGTPAQVPGTTATWTRAHAGALSLLAGSVR
jgi:alpha-tubulin suppressor-like RCC1 family protein